MSLSSLFVGRGKGQLQILRSWGENTPIVFYNFMNLQSRQDKNMQTKVTPIFPVKINILPKALLTLPYLYPLLGSNLNLFCSRSFALILIPGYKPKGSFLNDQTHSLDFHPAGRGWSFHMSTSLSAVTPLMFSYIPQILPYGHILLLRELLPPWWFMLIITTCQCRGHRCDSYPGRSRVPLGLVP